MFKLYRDPFSLLLIFLSDISSGVTKKGPKTEAKSFPLAGPRFANERDEIKPRPC